MGTNGGVGASWLRRRGGVVAGVVGLALVVGLVAFQLRGDGPAVIRLAAGGGGEALTVAEMDAGPARADLMLWQPVEYRFVLTEGAMVDAGEAHAWTLSAPDDLQAYATRLADRFGLGAVAPAPFGDGLVAGEPDGRGPTLWVGPGGEWSHHAPGTDLGWVCAEPALPLPSPDDEVEDTAAEGSGEGGEPRVLLTPEDACEPPAPPTGVPTEAEARALAAALFDDLDLPGRVTIDDVWADEWGAWVHGSISLEGVPADLSVSAAYGADAVLTSVSSTLASPTSAGLYPTIDAERAIQRLEELGGGWGVLTDARPMPLPGVLDAPTSSGEVASGATTTTEVDVPEDTRPAPMPTEPVEELPFPGTDAEPEEVTVTLVDVTAVLLLQWDVDGTTWLLPGYRFTDAEGGLWQVLAVDDDYLDVGEPADGGAGEPEPGVVDPAEPGPDVTDPADPDDSIGPEPGAVDPSEPEPGDGDGAGVDPVPGDLPDLGSSPEARDLAHRVIGMTEEEAVELVETAGLASRVVERDGEGLPRTDDLQPDRINLHVDDGIVVHATLG